MIAAVALILLQAAAPAPKASPKAAPTTNRQVNLKFDAAFFAGADANRDGWLGQVEFTAAIERTLLSEMRRYPGAAEKFMPTVPQFRERMGGMYRMLDKDGNARLTPAELAAAATPPAARR